MPIVVSPTTDTTLGEAVTGSTLGHVEVGLSRLIERWKNQPNVIAFLRSYLEEMQELEEAIWFVIFGRMPDYAEGDQLDQLGKIVGRRREGLPDELFRVFIKAQIRVNQSFGRALDVIEIIQIVESAAFLLTERPIASMLVRFLETTASGYVSQAIVSLVKAGRAGGVSLLVVMPVDRLTSRSARFGSVYSPTLNASIGFSSSYDPTVGGLWAHAARA